MKFRICATELGSNQSPRLNTSASISRPYCADIAIKHRNFAGKLWLGGAALLAASLAQGAAFTPGNLAVLRVGDGAAPLTNACTAIFVDEYSTAGSLVQSIALPTADAGANNAICLSGTATSEGFMTRTVDGQALVVAGYDAVPGTAGIATAAGINRVVAIIAADGTVNTSNSFIDGFTLNNVRSAAANSASAIYMGGTGGSASGGARLLSTTGAFTTTTQISTSVTNTRAVGIFAGQLFTSTGSAPFRLASVGSGLPTTAGQTTTNLPGFATATTSPFQFVFADLDAGVAGLDTLWVANDDATALQKHSFNGTVWSAINSVGVATDSYRGLTRIGTTLYATGRSSGVGVIRSLPSGGFNAALSGVPSLLATAAANRVFQGIAATPEAAAPLPVLSISDATADETSTLGTDSNFVFNLNLSAPAPAGGVSGTFSTSDGTATAGGTSNQGGNDYASQSNAAFSIAAGASSGTVSVPVRGDITFEVNETFNVTLNAAGLTGASLGTSTALGSIDNDDASPIVLVNSPSVVEGTGPGATTLTFNLSLDVPTQQPCDFLVETFASADAQGGGVDYDDVPSTGISLSGASQTAVVNVNIVRDSLTEPNETFALDLVGEPFACSIFNAEPIATIIDDDAGASATVAINSNTISEGDVGTSNMAFTITRSNSNTAFSVPYTVANVTANASDYSLVSGSLNFTVGGALTQTVTALINGDTTIELDESFTVTLGVISDITGVTQVLGGLGVGTGNIRNDDFPAISVTDASAVEGNTMTLTLTLAVPAITPVTGGLSTGNTTVIQANAGVDYTSLNSAPFSIAVGDSTATVTLTTLADSVFEGPETFNFGVSFANGADILAGDPDGIGTIIDNDSPPAISFNSVSANEGTGGAATEFQFTATLVGNAFERGVAFPVTVSGGTATSGVDYNSVSAVNLPFSPGDTSAGFAVTVIPDFDLELDESFQITAAALPGGAASTAGSGTIINDDALPTISVNSVSAAEGSALAFTLTLNANAPAGGVSGTVSTGNLGANQATAGSDYTTLASTPFTISAGNRTAIVTVNSTPDLVHEFDETFSLSINASGLTNASLGTPATGTGTIVEDDAQPLINFTNVSRTEGNGGGSTSFSFTATLASAAERETIYQISTADGTALGSGASADFVELDGDDLIFAAGVTSATVAVSVNADSTIEPDERFEIFGLPLIAAPGLVPQRGTGTIIDDDSLAATVSVNDTSVNEGNSGNTTMTFTVTRTDASTAQTVQAGVTGFASPGIDYIEPTPNPQTLSFAIGELSKTVDILIIGDRVWEPSENMNVILRLPTGGLIIADNAGVGVIVNDDLPVINISNASVTEGDGPGTIAMSFTLTAVDPMGPPSRSQDPNQINGGPPPGQITVSYRTVNGSALSAGDFIAVDSTVFMAPSQRMRTVTVQIVGDTTTEPTEQFTLETHSNLGFTIGQTGTGTINDNDVAASAIVSIASESVTETNSDFVRNFTITRSNNLTAFTVLVSSASISATVSTDYDPGAPQVITFTEGGALTATIPVTIVGDNIVESTETFELNLGALNNTTGTTTISNAVATGTILDDDTLITIANEGIAEGNSGLTPMVFTLTRTGITNVAHSVTLRSVDSSAMVSNNDYQAIDQIVTFAIGETSKQVSVNVVGDRFWEAEEFFRMNLSSPSANVQIGPQGFGNISADDQPKINISDVVILEGNSGTVNAVFTVTASDDLMPPIRSNALVPNGSNTFIEIDFATAPGSATSGTDYTATNGFLNFDLNDRSKTITVPVIGDTSVEMDETFLVNLSLRAGSNPVRFDDGVGQGTIQNDDAAATTITLAASPSALTYGQATTLTATVTCGSTPTGSVTFSNGASSLGSGALIAGSAAGTGIATLNLPLLDVASYSVIASYAGVAPCNGATSSASTVVVNPAATSLSLSGPARSRINQPTAFSGALNVLAPGAGTPSGTVTLSSVGSSSCSYSSPSATSCNLSWNSFGSKTITASFAPSTGNYLVSSSNSASTFVFALADLDVSLSNQVSSYQANDILVYTLTLNNRGPDFAPGVRLRSQLPSGLFKIRWTCTAVAGAICPEAGGVEDIDALVQTLPANGQLIYTLSGVVVNPAPLVIRATAAVTLPDDGTIEDPILTNQSATDTDAIDGILRDGFEDQ